MTALRDMTFRGTLVANLPVLSLREPWLHAVLRLGKPIENRKWKTLQTGTVLLHRAKGMTQAEYIDARAFILRVKPTAFGLPHEPKIFKAMHSFGGIAGVADIVSCKWNGEYDGDPCADSWPEKDRQWAMHGQYGFRLENVAEIPFVPCRGALGFFHLDAALIEPVAIALMEKFS